jgi:hypothetical protein
MTTDTIMLEPLNAPRLLTIETGDKAEDSFSIPAELYPYLTYLYERQKKEEENLAAFICRLVLPLAVDTRTQELLREKETARMEERTADETMAAEEKDSLYAQINTLV